MGVTTRYTTFGGPRKAADTEEDSERAAAALNIAHDLGLEK